MNPRERLAAAIRGEATDCAPVSLWKHRPQIDQDPAALAQTIAAEIAAAKKQTLGPRLMLAPGCGCPIDTPDAQVWTAVDAARGPLALT